jgi:hypothetical protein
VSDVTTIAVDAGALRGLHEAAQDAPAALLWLLDSTAIPAPDALDVLLEHAPGPAASVPVDRAGDAVVALMGRITEHDTPGILDAVSRRRLPLRHTHVTSLLVERDLVLALEPPDPERFGWYAGREWTSRLFARRRGWLVPASRVEACGPAAGAPRHVLRAARSGGWRRGETLKELQRSVSGVLA